MSTIPREERELLLSVERRRERQFERLRLRMQRQHPDLDFSFLAPHPDSYAIASHGSTPGSTRRSAREGAYSTASHGTTANTARAITAETLPRPASAVNNNAHRQVPSPITGIPAPALVAEPSGASWISSAPGRPLTTTTSSVEYNESDITAAEISSLLSKFPLPPVSNQALSLPQRATAGQGRALTNICAPNISSDETSQQIPIRTPVSNNATPAKESRTSQPQATMVYPSRHDVPPSIPSSSDKSKIVKVSSSPVPCNPLGTAYLSHGVLFKCPGMGNGTNAGCQSKSPT